MAETKNTEKQNIEIQKEEEKEKMLKAATFTKNCLRHSDK